MILDAACGTSSRNGTLALMSAVHPTAILEGDVELADDVVIGPHCAIRGPVTIGAGTRLLGSVWIQGPTIIGSGNTLYPFATLGLPPQDLKWDPAVAGAGLVIGNANVFRESVSIHRATSHERPTTIGDGNYFMACSHAGHDCRVGSNNIFGNGTLLGGHVQVADRVVAGGGSAVHQFVRIGRGCMLSGLAGLSLDLPPYFTLTAANLAGSINLVGLRRSGASGETIDDVRWSYRTLYRSGVSPRQALPLLRERESHPMVAEYIEFVASTRRGVCPGRGKSTRGTAAPRAGA